MTNYPVVRHLFGFHTQAARLWGTCNYPLSLFACRVTGKLMRFAPSDNLFILK